jgi:O26-antigen biosynthesis N-acetyl-L-fucosamine transferase
VRILLIVVYYPPSTTSAAQMMSDLAREYVRQGHQTMVVSPSDSIKKQITVSTENGVSVLRVRVGDMKSSIKPLRLWRESSLSRIIWQRAQNIFRDFAPDIVIYYSPSIFFGNLVSRLKAALGCHSYLVLRDIFPQWAVTSGLLREGGFLHSYLRRKELEQYACADVIGVEAPGNLAYFNNAQQGTSFHTEVLLNWVCSYKRALFEQEKSSSMWRVKLGLCGKVVFFYGGNIGVAQDMDNIVRLANNVRTHENIYFLLVGAGSEVERLSQEINKLKLNNIRILSALPENEYLRCLNEFDVGLVSLDKRLQSNNMTGKLLGYALCGKPILASVNEGNDLLTLINSTCSGIAVANGDDEDFCNATLTLANDIELRQKFGENARILSNTIFSVERASKQILSHFAHPNVDISNSLQLADI